MPKQKVVGLGFFCKPKNAQGNIRIAWKMNTETKYDSLLFLEKDKSSKKGIPWIQSVLIHAIPKRLDAQKGQPSISSGGEIILPKPSKHCNARQTPQEVQLLTLPEFVF